MVRGSELQLKLVKIKKIDDPEKKLLIIFGATMLGIAFAIFVMLSYIGIGLFLYEVYTGSPHKNPLRRKGQKKKPF